MTLEQFIEIDEGFVPHAYQDSEGYWTIGIGTLIDEKKGGGITREEAQWLLRRRVEKLKEEIRTHQPKVRILTEAREYVIYSMCYQMGVQGVLNFRKMWTAIKSDNYEEAANQMLDSLWAKQTPHRARKYAEIMRTGEFVK